MAKEKFNNGYKPCKHQYLTLNEGSVCLGNIEKCGYFDDQRHICLHKEFHEKDIQGIIETYGTYKNRCFNVPCKETRKQIVPDDITSKLNR